MKKVALHIVIILLLAVSSSFAQTINAKGTSHREFRLSKFGLKVQFDTSWINDNDWTYTKVLSIRENDSTFGNLVVRDLIINNNDSTKYHYVIPFDESTRDSISDNASFYYDATAKTLKAGPLAEVTPEMFTTIEEACEYAAENELVLSFYPNKSYNISAKIDADLQGKELIINGNGAKIVSTYAEAGSYGTPIAAFKISNGDAVTINNLTVKATNTGLSPATNYLCALLITGVPKVFIEKCKFTDAPYIGLWLVHADQQFSVRDCEAKRCLYAGIAFSSSKNGLIENCEIDTIGYKLPQYGYGITLIKQDEDPRQDENIVIRDNHVKHCQRKSIDLHNAVNALVTGNQCYGFGYGGIYAVSEWDGTNVRNISVTYNDISQDSVWFAGVDVTDDPETYWVGVHPLQLGSTGNLTVYGSFNATGNYIHDCNSAHADLSAPYLKYMVHSFTDRAENLIISKNTLESSNPLYGIYLNGSAYGQYDIASITGNHLTDITATELIYIRSGRIINIKDNPIRNCTADDAVKISGDGAGSDIGIVNIDSHPIEGTFATGIWVGTGEFASVNNNTGAGTFTSNFVYIESGIPYKSGNNTSNGIQIPDDTTYAYWGRFRNILMDDPSGSDGVINNLNGDLDFRASGYFDLGYNDTNDGIRYFSGTTFKFGVDNSGIANAIGGYKTNGTLGYLSSAYGSKTVSGLFTAPSAEGTVNRQLNYVNLTINGVTYKVLIADE